MTRIFKVWCGPCLCIEEQKTLPSRPQCIVKSRYVYVYINQSAQSQEALIWSETDYLSSLMCWNSGWSLVSRFLMILGIFASDLNDITYWCIQKYEVAEVYNKKWKENMRVVYRDLSWLHALFNMLHRTLARPIVVGDKFLTLWATET